MSGELPAGLMAAAQRELDRETVPKPFWIRWLPWILGMWVLCGLVFLYFVFAPSAASGTYIIDNVTVTRAEFMHRIGVSFVAWGIVGILAAVPLWGLHRQSRWARPFTLVLFMAGAIVSVGTFSRDPAAAIAWPFNIICIAAVTASCWWYFYRKQDVVRYYHRLDRETVPKPGPRA